MNKKTHIIPLRGNVQLIDDLQIFVDGHEVKMPSKRTNINQQSNIRVIIENGNSVGAIDALLPASSMISSNNVEANFESNAEMTLKFGNGLFDEIVDIELEKDSYRVTKSIYFERPISNFLELHAIPIPIDLLTVYIRFEKLTNPIQKVVSENQVDAVFDAYSHLGFFLVDLPQFKQVLTTKYANQPTDVVTELTTTELVEELFAKKIVMMVWGINPYTYPIYSVSNLDQISPILGVEFGSSGIYNIDESVNELTIISGSELRHYPDFLEKDWPKIKIYGKGERTYLKPYQLKDDEGQTVVASFLIHRDTETLDEAIPLMNVDLLYS